MRTFQLPHVIRNGLVVGPLALVVAAPVAAAEPASSVSFVNRDALTATSTNGWRNPLRSSSDAASAESETGNSLRDEVTPVSYDQEVDAGSPDESANSQGGVKLRPHTQPTGIFSGLMSDGKNAFTKPRVATHPAEQPQFRKAQTAPETATNAAEKALSMMPRFQSSGARQQAKSSNAQTAMIARAVSPAPRPNQGGARQGGTQQFVSQNAGARQFGMQQAGARQAGTQRPAANGASTASYNTAASAEAYRHNAAPAGGTAATRRSMPANATARPMPNSARRQTGEPLARPSLDSTRPTVGSGGPELPPAARIAARPINQSEVDSTSPAGILTQAHELAATAQTEDDFSKIFAMCQKVPARTATAEETAFGRELAAWSLNRRGQLRARVGNRDAAMADFEQAIHIDNTCWRALHNRGVMLAQAGQFEPAFDDFHHTIELNPGYAKAYANRAALYVLAGEIEPALADYQQAIGLDPKFAIAERGCGRTCHMLGRMDEALEHLTKAIELAPRDAAAVASRGDLLTDMGQYEEAAHDYEQALRINPKFADAYRGSAWLLATCPDGQVRNPGVALERAKRAVKLDRKADPTTFDTLAAAQASVGDFKAAEQTIRHAIEIASPSERSVYQDRLQMYQHAHPYRIEPVGAVQQTSFEE